MKINILYITIPTVILIGCGNNHKQSEKVDTNVTIVETATMESTDSYEESATTKGVSENDKIQAISDLKSWGAVDAYFDGDYLCYVVSESSLSASPREVGKAMYPMFSDIVGIKGIKIVSAESRKTLDTYPE